MKNLKLLLATTAMLSAGLAMGALADTPVTAATYTNRATAKLDARIYIYSPITMTDGVILFPSITTTNMYGSAPITVKVNPDGTIAYGESTAQIIDDTEVLVNPIKITGGSIGSIKSDYTAEGADAAALDEEYSDGLGFYSGIHNVQLAETIPMYVMNGDNATNTKCGEVGALVPEWHYTNYKNDGKGALELSIGGTFTLENFELNDGSVHCKGSTTVTYIMDN